MNATEIDQQIKLFRARVKALKIKQLTPIGYCVESEREKGSVQIYPEAALELFTP